MNNHNDGDSLPFSETADAVPLPPSTEGMPVIGTLPQWRSLSATDRRTLVLLDDRMRRAVSVEQIREFFVTGRGREFPPWVRENFLQRRTDGVAAELTVSDDPPEDPPPQRAPKLRRPRRLPKSKTGAVGSLAAPTLLLRSATFQGAKTRSEDYRTYTPIAALKGIQLHGKGNRLSTLDLVNWLGAVKLARAGNGATRVRVKFRALLEAIGRSDGARSRVLLQKSLERIAGFTIRFDAMWGERRTVYAGPLLSDFRLPGARSSNYDCELTVPAGVWTLFEAGETYLNVADLRLLRQRPLCLWLWGFYKGHGKAFDMFVETVQRLAGFEGPTFEFRRLLREGLKSLEKQSFIHSWSLDEETDKVTIVRKPSKTGD